MSNDYESHANKAERNGRASFSFDFQMSRKRRRFMVVPKTERDLSLLQDAYSIKDREFGASSQNSKTTFDTFASSSQRRICRPLPSTQVLMSMLNETNSTRDNTIEGTKPSSTSTSLLLRKFYKSIGINNDMSANSKSTTMDDVGGIDNETKKLKAVDEIDDPSFSTLKRGHHNRYLKLTTQQQTSKRTFAQRKELEKLQQMISKEQALYRSAIEKFHETYKSRYLIGFESKLSSKCSNDEKASTTSNFCRWACSHAQSINQEWKKRIGPGLDENISKLPRCYGKVRQTLALHYGTQQSSLDVEDLICSVVQESSPIEQTMSPSSLSSVSAKIPEVSPKAFGSDSTCRILSPPTTDLAPPIRMIRDDKKAIGLAIKYSAVIITTSDTLETLLRLPGHHSSKWMVPCTTRRFSIPTGGSRSVTFLDVPIAQTFSSPRSCLEMGFKEGIYQAFLAQHKRSQSSKERQGETSTPVSQVIYSLWTLPTKNAGRTKDSRNPIRVLVRTLVRLRDSMTKLPIRIRTRVEYFNTAVSSESRSRREIPNSYERSLWILDQVLFGHQVLGLQYRIDPTTCEIVGWDTTSVAHAFASSEADGILGDHSKIGPLDHWKALIQLLQSIPSIDMPDALLCLPGLMTQTTNVVKEMQRKNSSGEGKRNTFHTTNHEEQVRLDAFSVSVHSACEDSSVKHLRESASSDISPPSSPSPGTIRLDESVLDHAGAVILGDKAIRDCRREWEWDRTGQVPHTFPVTVDTAEQEAKSSS